MYLHMYVRIASHSRVYVLSIHYVLPHPENLCTVYTVYVRIASPRGTYVCTVYTVFIVSPRGTYVCTVYTVCMHCTQ